jgi:hypothetical protein
MEPCYRNLREALFVNSAELLYFRSLVVTATLATDIADKELAAMRKDRAAEALAVLDEEGPTSDDIASLTATFVLETLIQVADVSHLMMPFEVYKKWNFKLLRETHQAFTDGRAEKDPIDTWYQGEFGFFDFYIIPLAKKLEKCGIDSSFYVENAMNNRRKWEEVGEDLVKDFQKTVRVGRGSFDIADFQDTSSSSESDCDSYSFGEVGESDSEGESDDDDGNDDEASASNPRQTTKKPPLNSAVETLRMIQKQKMEEYSHRLSKGSKQECVTAVKRHTLTTHSERTGRTVDSCISGVSEHAGRSRRIVYKSKAASQHLTPPEKGRLGRSHTAVPEGERRYKQRSKSASCEPNGLEVKSDEEKTGKIARRKKKSRSRSLENSSRQKKSMKGKRPGKIKQKCVEA